MLPFHFRNSPQALRNPPNGDPDRAGRFAVTCLVIGLSLLLFPFLWKPWIHGNDGVRHYAYCRSLCLDGDFDFTNEFAHYVQAGELEEVRIDPRTGRPGNSQGIGAGILWIPFFLAGHGAARALGFPADGYSAPYVWAVSFGTVFYAVAGLFLLTRMLCWRFKSRAALLAVLGVWLGTPLVFYMYLHPSMSHGCSFFLSTLLFWQYERWRDRQLLRHFFFLGLTAGLALATRLNDGVLLLVPGAFWLRAAILGLPSEEYRGQGRGIFCAALATAAGLLVGFFPQMAAWRYFYDAWIAGPRDYELARNLDFFSSPHLFDLLFSGWRGLFVWSPILLPAVVGMALLLRRRRLLDAAAFAAFLVQVWVIGGWAIWYGGASFGQRFFINLLPAFAVGLAVLFLYLREGGPRKCLVAVTALCILWNAGLAVQYASHMIDREKRVTVRELASNQFVRVPGWVWDHLRFLSPRDRIESPARPE